MNNLQTHPNHADQPSIASAAHKAYERGIETLEDARLAPPTGERDKSLRLIILDYFETAEKQKKQRRLRTTIGIAIFAIIFICQARMELLLLHHMGWI